MADEERRATRNPLDISGGIAILYTLGFLLLAGMLYFNAIPPTNKDALLYLFGILSGIELSIINFYFGGSKTVEASTRAMEQRQGRADAVVQKIAEAAPQVAAAVVAAQTVVPVVIPAVPLQMTPTDARLLLSKNGMADDAIKSLTDDEAIRQATAVQSTKGTP